MHSTAPSQADSIVPMTGTQHGEESQNRSRYEPTPSVTPGQPNLSREQQQQRCNNDSRGSNDNHHHHNNDTSGSTTVGEDEEEYLMACRCESGKTLFTLLSCLQHIAESPSDQAYGRGSGGLSSANATQSTGTTNRRSYKKQTIQPVTVFCTPSKFTFHVFGPANQSEATVELQKSLFSHYQVLQQPSNNEDDNNDDEDDDDWRSGGEFCVNLCTVLNCLQILGPLDHRISVGLTYNLTSEVFKIELMVGAHGDNPVMCTAAIPGLNSPSDDPEGGSLSAAFRSAPVAARMMLRSGILRELLPEWSSVSGATCAAVAVSKARGLELAVLGHYGECVVTIPATGDHLISPLEFANPKKAVSRTYPLHSLLSSMKGLDLAEETCININTEGIMAIQHKTIDPTGQGESNFVDFIMTCLKDDDEDVEKDDVEEENEDEAVSQASPSIAATTQSQASSLRSHTQLSPESTVATRDEARSRRPRKSPFQSSKSDRTADHSDIDIEGVTESPSERQRSLALARRKEQQLDSDENDDDDEDKEESQPISAIATLFGAVVNETGGDHGTKGKTPPRRRRRHRSTASMEEEPGRAKRGKGRSGSSARRRGSNNNSDDDEEESVASRNMLLAGSSEDERSASEAEEDLDITALARSPQPRNQQHNRDGNCSSPELVYGEQT